MNNRKGQIQSNPFGFQSNNFKSNEEVDNSWNIGEDETQKLNQTNNNSGDFWGDQQNTNRNQQNQFETNRSQQQQQQPQHAPFGNQNAFNQQGGNQFDMQGMIDLNNEQNSSQQQSQNQQQQNNNTTQYEDGEEPPLLEDLGINIELIKERILCVAKLQKCDERFLSESDMSGPILIGFTLGILLMLSAKIHFGYIYGFSICGTICLYFILNLLAQHRQVQLYNTFSILGYCLLPIILVAAFSVFINLKDHGMFGFIISSVCILWSTYMASTFFEEVLQLNHQKYLAAYPILLFYSTFVLITVF